MVTLHYYMTKPSQKNFTNLIQRDKCIMSHKKGPILSQWHISWLKKIERLNNPLFLLIKEVAHLTNLQYF